MTEQLVIHRHDYDAGNQGLSWARIIGIAFVIALHLTALMIPRFSDGFDTAGTPKLIPIPSPVTTKNTG
ncbi:hypothetical protein P2A59_20170, partial [Xanthomonas perforans]